MVGLERGPGLGVRGPGHRANPRPDARSLYHALGALEHRAAIGLRTSLGRCELDFGDASARTANQCPPTAGAVRGSRQRGCALRCELLTTDGYTFQHRLSAPSDLQIETVSVLEDGVQRVAHWGRDRSGVITVFLTAPVTGTQHLSIEGNLPCPAVGQMGLPLLKFDESEFKDTVILVYRRPGVVASVDDQVGINEVAERLEPDNSRWPRDRLAVSLVATSESPSAKLPIRPMPPALRSSR